MLTEQITVVGCKDNERILCESERVEVVEDFADIFVHQEIYRSKLPYRGGIAVGADMLACRASNSRFLYRKKSRDAPAGSAGAGGAVFMLAGHDRRKGKFFCLIHGVPWGRSKIVGMRIEKARP